jgi:hypothetical protein
MSVRIIYDNNGVKTTIDTFAYWFSIPMGVDNDCDAMYRPYIIIEDMFFIHVNENYNRATREVTPVSCSFLKSGETLLACGNETRFETGCTNKLCGFGHKNKDIKADCKITNIIIDTTKKSKAVFSGMGVKKGHYSMEMFDISKNTLANAISKIKDSLKDESEDIKAACKYVSKGKVYRLFPQEAPSPAKTLSPAPSSPQVVNTPATIASTTNMSEITPLAMPRMETSPNKQIQSLWKIYYPLLNAINKTIKDSYDITDWGIMQEIDELFLKVRVEFMKYTGREQTLTPEMDKLHQNQILKIKDTETSMFKIFKYNTMLNDADVWDDIIDDFVEESAKIMKFLIKFIKEILAIHKSDAAATEVIVPLASGFADFIQAHFKEIGEKIYQHKLEKLFNSGEPTPNKNSFTSVEVKANDTVLSTVMPNKKRNN